MPLAWSEQKQNTVHVLCDIAYPVITVNIRHNWFSNPRYYAVTERLIVSCTPIWFTVRPCFVRAWVSVVLLQGWLLKQTPLILVNTGGRSILTSSIYQVMLYSTHWAPAYILIYTRLLRICRTRCISYIAYDWITKIKSSQCSAR